MSGELTTAQVADYLGVKAQTVYAYVSRGVLTPVRREAKAGSLFAIQDVRALAAQPGRSGRRSRRSTSDDVRTAITEVGPASLAYRGHDVRDLAGSWSFEQVRDLLTNSEPGRATGSALADGRGAGQLQGVMAALAPSTPTLDRFKHAVLVAAGADAGRHDRRAEAFAGAGRRAATFMAASLPGAHPEPGLAATLAAYLKGVPVDLVDTALVLLADHDLAASTTAVRVAVSAGSDPYSALLAGLAAADSPLHVAASLDVTDWLRASLRDPQRALDSALARSTPPGFGHVVYTEQDPRADVLLHRLRQDCDPGAWAALRHLEHELLQRRDAVLTVDVALALMVLTYGLPRDAGAVIFACARTAGWTAHAIEELAEPAMRFRLRGVYTGARSGAQ